MSHIPNVKNASGTILISQFKKKLVMHQLQYFMYLGYFDEVNCLLSVVIVR